MNLNPMGLNGPNWGGNYVQPNASNPTAPQGGAQANVVVGANMLELSWPIASYSQPGTPSGNTLSAWANQDATPTVQNL